MNSRIILPPFPFPERWVDIDLLQRATGERKWLVPSSEHIDVAECDSSSTHKHDQHNSIEKTVLPHCEDWNGVDEYDGCVETEEFELDPAWAARFSKTIKKMKQKVHKAKRKAEWKKK